MAFSRHLAATLAWVVLLSLPGRPTRADGVSAKDARGKVVSLARPAGKVVCLIESALSGLFMLGAGPAVAGIPAQVYGDELFPRYARLDPRIANRSLPAPGNWDFVGLESVLVLDPDLVILWSEQRESIRALEERGIPVFGVFVSGVAGLREEILALGTLTGKGGRAHELLAFVDSEVARVQLRTVSQPRVSAYFAWGGGMLETSCGGSMVDDLLTLAGGRNVCGGLRAEHRQINVERLMLWDPAVIFLWPDPGRKASQVATDRRFAGLSAVGGNALFELPDPFLADQWTLKYLHAVKAMAKAMHPAQFRDLDLGTEAEVMLRALYGGGF